MDQAPKKRSRRPPQKTISDFWSKFIEQKPSKVNQVFPSSLYSNLLPRIENEKGSVKCQNASDSYESAAKNCRERVSRIIRECHRTNEKFTDAEFDLQSDLWTLNCRFGLMRDDQYTTTGNDATALGDSINLLITTGLLGNDAQAPPVSLTALQAILSKPAAASKSTPGSVHRVDWIFDDPRFVINGYSESDVRQGAIGDCWWLAALATLTSVEGLIEKICVAKDEECGVYGFVFFRDGEWTWVVIDDNLYLTYPDREEMYDPTGDKERKYKQRYQTGSEALYFASCEDENETWLPLLEKAYAKLHGDYTAISGGITGEGVEDMSGGVTLNFQIDRILSKERLWKEFLNEKKEFLFGVSSPSGGYSDDHSRQGLALNHAYSVLKAVEEIGEDGRPVKLVKIRNPWGHSEWNGAWSDGSKEWSPYWMKKLNHKFGDDGIFWMAYPDVLKRFQDVDRTRLFNNEWNVVQIWTTINVAWMTGFHKTKFKIRIATTGPVVIVLSQLDDRYFQGLQGQYTFYLHFILRKSGASDYEEIVRVRGRNSDGTDRSISAEIDLDAGDYEVLPKITATRDSSKPRIEDVVKEYAERNPQKLRQIGLNHDIANGKAVNLRDLEKSEEVSKAEAAKKKEAKNAEKQKTDNSKITVTVEIRPKTPCKPEDNAPEDSTVSSQVKIETKKGQEAEKEKDSGKEKDADKESIELSSEGHDNPQDPPEGQDAEEEIEDEKKNEDSDDDETDINVDDPWNAVCSLGLRVYSKSMGTTVEIATPSNAEGAALEVNSDTPAGVTT